MRSPRGLQYPGSNFSLSLNVLMPVWKERMQRPSHCKMRPALWKNIAGIEVQPNAHIDMQPVQGSLQETVRSSCLGSETSGNGLCSGAQGSGEERTPGPSHS